MSPDVIQQAASLVREKLAAGKKTSATAKRLDQIIALLDAEGRTSISRVLEAIYPETNLSTKTGRTKGLANLRKYRQTVNAAAEDAGVSFRIVVDEQNRTPPHQRLLWIECGDSNPASTREIEKWNKAEARSAEAIVAPEGVDFFDNRPIVHYYIVCAEDPVDKKYRNALLNGLGGLLANHSRFRFRRSVEFEIPASGSWRRGIEQETAHCQFGLMLLTYKFLESGFLRTEQGFCKSAVVAGNAATASCIPVAVGAVMPHEDLLSGLPPSAVLFGPNGLSWSRLKTAAEREIFVQSLAERILKYLDEAAALATHIERLSDDEAAKEFDARAFTRGGGARTRIENSAASAAGSDSASANREDALDFLLAWVQDPAAPAYCALLAEYGMGKTTTCKALTREMTARRAGGEKLPLPIYFDLRPIGSRALDLNLEQILALLINDEWKAGAARIAITPRDIIDQVRKAGALIIWDGLDEVLVHLDTAAGQRFTRQLYSILPPDTSPDTNAEGRSRLLITCRTHYFRTLPEQKNHFLADERDSIRAENYRAFILLPFTGEQIREYIGHTLPGEDASRVIETLESIHNLRELAERPYTLHLIAREFANIEKWKQEGRRVTGLTLYRHMVRSWLLRDTGKHHFKSDHKQFLMERFAARLWQRGTRYWSIAQIEEWLGELLHENPVFAAGYTQKAPALLEEDLRTATFLVRDGEDKFRFAHTSLQEYFLAGYLRRALVEGKPEHWRLPEVSRETLNFLGQWLLEEEGPEQTAALNTLEYLRDDYHEKASVLAFRYFLLAHRKGYPAPSAAGFQLPGADLDDWRIEGSAQLPLILNGANFRGATLNQTRWTHCRLENAQFEQASVERAEFVDCDLSHSRWSHALLEATLFRKCETAEAVFDGARMRQTHSVLSSPDIAPSDAALAQSEAVPATASGHSDSVRSCAWSPDGRQLASASYDNTLRLWDAVSGKLLRTLEGHSDSVLSCAWSPDGRQLASASYDNTLRLWDAVSGKLLRTLEGHSSSVWSCAWSPDGRQLASASSDNTLRLWDAVSGKLLRTLEGHSSSVRSCAWSPDGRQLASASYDNTLRLWDAVSGKLLRTLEGHSSSVRSCAWSPDGRQLASASSDNTLRLWDAVSGKLLRTLEGHSDSVLSCAWSPDGRQLASASDDNTLRLWDAVSGKLLRTLEGHSSSVRSCAWSPDGRQLASASYDNTLRLWDTVSGKLLRTLEGHSDSVWSCAWSPDGRQLASASYDNTLRLWDAVSGKLLRTLEGHSDSVRSCAWSPDGRQLASASSDNTLRLWDAVSGKLLRTLEGHSSSVLSCAWSPDGRQLASASYDNTLRLWDAVSGKLLRTLEGHSDSVWSCAWSPDGRQLASASYDNTLRLWDAVSGKLLRTLEGHSDSVWSCAWSPDGRQLASASDDNTLRLWDAVSGKLLRTLEGHSSSVRSCAWSPDGRQLASASYDNTLRLWDTVSGKLLRTLEGHSDSVWSCAWSPDGRQLASASDDGTLRLWDAESGRQMQPVLYSFRAPDAPPSWAAIDHDANRVVACGREAWRSLGWLVPDSETGLRWLPAEYFGELPEEGEETTG